MKTYEITTSKGEFVVVDIAHCIDEAYQDGDVFYKLICKLSEATEGDLYVNGFIGNNLVDELHSLLKSKGIDVNNGNWYLFKKLK